MALPTVIAIDGPVASGKTSVGRALAERLGYRFVDTGTMYRAITWVALAQAVPLDDEQALESLAAETEIGIESAQGGHDTVLANGVDVTALLTSADVEGAVSLVSRVAAVRRTLVAAQQRMAAAGRVVMVGRDIGTVVLPDAPLKLFLEASPQERVRRRHQELRMGGRAISVAKVREGLEGRDSLDSQRAESPLRAASDACRVQTDGLTVAAVVERIIAMMRKE